tara:strand:+ start:2329 stop:2862 length:534 start_codon:yes stop_codon:yes gene_type:complete
MHKYNLSEIAMYYGNVKMPKGYEIKRGEIKHQLVYNKFVEKNKLNNDDIKITDTTDIIPLLTYIKDFFNLKFDVSLRPNKFWGNIYETKEHSKNKNNIDRLSYQNSPDYTLIYGVDIYDKKASVTFEYDDNRRIGKSWTAPLRDNHFIMFPSTLNYTINKNKHEKFNTYLTITFDYR